MLQGPVAQLPPINQAHPLSRGLVAAFVADGSGRMVDLVRGLRLSSVSNATSINNQVGRAGDCAAVNGKGFRATLPSNLRLNYPITLIWAGVIKGTPTNSAGVALLSVNNTGTSPFTAITIGYGTSGVFQAAGGTSTSTSTKNASSYTDKFVVRATAVRIGTVEGWVNGVLDTSSAGPGSNPTYGASAQVEIGYFTSTTRNANVQTNLMLVYNRSLTAAEHRAIASNPWQIFSPSSRFALKDIGKATGLATITGTGNVYLKAPHLVGSGTVAVSGTGSAALKAPLLSGAGSVSISGVGSAALKPPRLVGHVTIPASFTYSYRQNSTARPPTSYTSTANLNDGSAGDTSTGETHTGSVTFGAGCAWQTVTGLLSVAAESAPFATISAGQFTWAASSSANAASTCIVPPDPPAETGEIVDFAAAYSLNGVDWTAIPITGDTTPPSGTATLDISTPIVARYVHIWGRTRRIEYDEFDTHTAAITISDLRLTGIAAPPIIGQGQGWLRAPVLSGLGTVIGNAPILRATSDCEGEQVSLWADAYTGATAWRIYRTDNTGTYQIVRLTTRPTSAAPYVDAPRPIGVSASYYLIVETGSGDTSASATITRIPCIDGCACPDWETPTPPACEWEASSPGATSWSPAAPSATTWTRGRCTG